MFFFFRKSPRGRRTDAMRPPSHPHGLGRAPGAMVNAAVATPGKQRGARGRKGGFAKSDGRPAKSQALGRSPAWGRPRIPFLVSRGAPCAIARGAPHIFFPRRLSRGKGLQQGAREGRVRRMTALRPPCVFFFYPHRTARTHPRGAIACIRRAARKVSPRPSRISARLPAACAPRPTICAQTKARNARLDQAGPPLAPFAWRLAPQAAARRATQTCATRASARVRPKVSTAEHANPSTEQGCAQTRYPPCTDFVPAPNIQPNPG